MLLRVCTSSVSWIFAAAASWRREIAGINETRGCVFALASLLCGAALGSTRARVCIVARHIHARTHACTNMHTRKYRRAHAHANIDVHMHTQTYTRTCTRTLTPTKTYTPTCRLLHKYLHTYLMCIYVDCILYTCLRICACSSYFFT